MQLQHGAPVHGQRSAVSAPKRRVSPAASHQQQRNGAVHQACMRPAMTLATQGLSRPDLRCSAAATEQTATRTGPGKAPMEIPVEIDSEDILALAPGVRVVRGTCRNKLRSEVEYMLKHGTSDNCYLVEAPDALALIDVPYEAYADKFVAALKGNISLKAVTHLVITHLDPKAIPTLVMVLRNIKAEGASVNLVLSNPALRLLQSTLGDKPETADLLEGVKLTTARSGQVVQLGSADPMQQLKLELTPTPRWPDLMVAYYPPSRVLFSSKFFSAHVSPSEDEVDDVGGWERYDEDWRYFFDCMLAPSARQALLALDKLDIMPVPLTGTTSTNATNANVRKFIRPLREEFGWLRAMLLGRSAPPAAAPLAASAAGKPPVEAALAVSILAPMHGPAVTSAVAQLLREYRSWINEQIKAADTAEVVVLYASAYGNTAALAQAISRGITKAGVGVTTLNLELASLEEVGAAIRQSDGFVLGSPTLGGHMPTQVSVSLGAIMREKKAQTLPCGVFGSFGWSGEAVDEMEGRLKDAGFNFAFPAIRVKFKPTAKDLLQCEDSGRDLALAIKKRARGKEAAAAPGVRAQAVANSAQLAAGRIVGSLCVMTAQDEDASAAMLASWVSQASFDPPGITVSVKKDRAMEPLLQVGNQFVVSTVAEGKDKKVMKALARPFSPDEDRLAGLETSPAPITGAALLKEANAYMECQVVSRMEAGDHYVIYATVLGGDVLSENAQTAVHYRKVANHY